MGLADQPDTMARWMADMERRMRTQETATRAASTSISAAGGLELVRLDREGIKVFDATGTRRVTIGLVDPANDRYGVIIYDADGVAARFWVDERGILTPYLAAPLVAASGEAEAVTSAVFVKTHSAQFEIISHLGIYCWVTALSDAATTGEMRLRNTATGAFTNAVSIPAGSAGTVQQFRWLHGSALDTGPVVFEVQARRTAGAGNINIYRPPGIWMTHPGLCTTGGAP